MLTTSCQTINGGSGLLSGPCSDNALRQQARVEAARVGGSGLLDWQCSDALVDRTFRGLDGGGAEESKTVRLTCEATVLRHADGFIAPARTDAGQPPASDRTTVTIASSEIGVDFVARDAPPGAPKAVARDPDAVGELDAVPDGHRQLGTLSGRCERSCSPAQVRRALRQVAAKHGALAIAGAQCEPYQDGWQCSATALGGPQPR